MSATTPPVEVLVASAPGVHGWCFVGSPDGLPRHRLVFQHSRFWQDPRARSALVAANPIGMEWGVGLGGRVLRGAIDVTSVGDVFEQIRHVWLQVTPPEAVQQHQADLRRRRGWSWVNPDVDLQARIDELNAGLQPRGSSRASSGQGLGARWWRRALAVANRLAKGRRHA